MIEFNVTDQRISLVSATSLGDNLVSNTENNYKCKFNFNETWNEYGRIAVFMTDGNEEERVSILIDENNECIIPLSVIKDECKIRVGVYGKAEGKSIPTVYSSSIMVRLGAIPNPEYVPEEPTEDIYGNIMESYARIIMFAQTFKEGAEGQVLMKVSDEDNDFAWQTIEGFVKEEDFNTTIANIDETKMEYSILNFDGSSIKLDGTTKTFSELKELCLNKKNFAYLLYSNRLYIPQYVNENNVWFEAAYIDNDIPYMHRIGINSRNSISVVTKALAVKSDMDVAKAKIAMLESNIGNIMERLTILENK